jgi:hypothetical protein
VKLTNPESIQESEKEFIDTINAELDWDALEKILFEKHGFAIQDEVDYKDGNLIVHNNEIAYKFDFEIKVPLSVIFNRVGECLEVSTLGDDSEALEKDLSDPDMSDPDMSEPDMSDPDMSEPDISIQHPKNEKIGQMASDIADMISEINEERE